jgi:hypothetical protein
VVGSVQSAFLEVTNMGVKYVRDFEFPAAAGFRDSAMPAKAGMSSKGMPSRAKPNAPARGAARMESKPKMGKGQGYAMGGKVPGREMDRLPAKKPPGRTMDLAPSKPFKGEYQGYAKGGKVQKYQAGGVTRAGARVASPRTEAQNLEGLRNINARYDARIYQAGLDAEARKLAESMAKGTFTGDLKNLLKKTPTKIGGGAIIGSLATSYGPDLMRYINSLMDRKGTVEATDMEGNPLPRARGGRVAKHMAPKAGKMGDMPKMMRRGRK